MNLVPLDKKLLLFLPELSSEEDLETTLDINIAFRGIILADFAKLGRVDPRFINCINSFFNGSPMTNDEEFFFSEFSVDLTEYEFAQIKDPLLEAVNAEANAFLRKGMKMWIDGNNISE